MAACRVNLSPSILSRYSETHRRQRDPGMDPGNLSARAALDACEEQARINPAHVPGGRVRGLGSTRGVATS